MLSIGDVKEIADLANKSKPWFKDFFSRPTIEQQFQEILSDLNAGKSPVVVADKLATAIQNKFSELQEFMSTATYHSFCREVLDSLLSHLRCTIYVWKNKIVYFSNVKEVWLTCEPMLDLVQSEDGTFELLKMQLAYVDKIKYYLSDKQYYDDLIFLLKKHNIDTNKIEFIKLDRKYISPIAIYFSDQPHGLIGTYHPHLSKGTNGFYSIENKLQIDWMNEIDGSLLSNHINQLTKYNK